MRALVTSMALLHGAASFSIPPSALRTSAVSMLAVDPKVLQEVAIYDSAMEDQLRDLEARATSAESNAAQQAATIEDLKKQLEAKSDEVEKFVSGVEAELKSARDTAEKLSAELMSVKAELDERTGEVTTLNAHLEAHTGATMRLNKEVESLKEALAAAEAKAADSA